MNNVRWLTYDFHVHAINTNWLSIGGVYIFTGVRDGRWRAYYIGETNNAKERLPNHERWAEAVRLGATHVHGLAVQQEATRWQIEAELIRSYQPPLNTQER